MQARSISRTQALIVALVMLVVLFAPMVAIHQYGSATGSAGRAATGELTVGIAVILRATARRLLRGASSGLLRTTIGALGRTSARALTRRSIKFTGRLLFSSVVQASVHEEAHSVGAMEPSRGSQVLALVSGFVGLCLSFLGILYVVGPEFLDRLGVGSSLTTLEVVLLAGSPLLAYAGLHSILGRWFGVRTTYRTEIDGLLLQAYFTGAGSFLPLTTDVEYEGDERGKRSVAAGSILGMFVIHLLLMGGGEVAGAGWSGSARLEFAGSMFLVYAFVYCFPIKPLEGYFVWSSSKLQWILVTLPILVAFLTWLPPEFGEIL
jgi:hypothetical protein